MKRKVINSKNLSPDSKEFFKRSLSERVADIYGFCQHWKNSRRLKSRAIHALFQDLGYPKGMSEQILESIWKSIHPSSLKRLYKETKSDEWWNQVTDKSRQGWMGLILPANVPDVLVKSTLQNYLMGYGSWIKVSSRQSRFANIFLNSLKTKTKYCGQGIAFSLKKSEFFKASKNLVGIRMYGHDATLNQVKKKIPSHIPIKCYGHHISAAILLKSGIKNSSYASLAKNIARDIWLHDQRGCLSPQMIYIENQNSDTNSFINGLDRELQKLNHKYGKIHRSRDYKTERRNRLHDLKIQSLNPKKLSILSSQSSLKKSCIYQLKQGFLNNIGSGQIAGIKFFSSHATLMRELNTHRTLWQCLAIAGSKADILRFQKKLPPSMKSIRICPPGQMQSPPLTWNL